MLLIPLLACAPDKPPAPDETAADTAGDVTCDTADDADGDGACAEDCQPADATIHPGAPEDCDGIDNNCDGVIDEGVSGIYYPDRDGDGYGDPDSADSLCPDDSRDGYADNGADCDDGDADVHPGAGDATSDGVDDDCDGATDEDATSAAMSVSVSWSSSGARITIRDGAASSWRFGMAETGAGAAGWFGESCIAGDEPRGYDDYGYDVCHTLGATGGTLTSVYPDVADVRAGYTLFDEAIGEGGDLSFVLFDAATDACWAWGDSPAYYAAYGCASL